jgi:hypothetical protein
LTALPAALAKGADTGRGHTGVMPVFVRKLFGIGKLPDDLRAEVDTEGVIYLADYVPVTRRFSGAIPGLRSAHSVASYVGSLVFTSQRVLATLSSLPKLAGPTVVHRTSLAALQGPGCRRRARRAALPITELRHAAGIRVPCGRRHL